MAATRLFRQPSGYPNTARCWPPWDQSPTSRPVPVTKLVFGRAWPRSSTWPSCSRSYGRRASLRQRPRRKATGQPPSSWRRGGRPL